MKANLTLKYKTEYQFAIQTAKAEQNPIIEN